MSCTTYKITSRVKTRASHLFKNSFHLTRLRTNYNVQYILNRYIINPASSIVMRKIIKISTTTDYLSAIDRN